MASLNPLVTLFALVLSSIAVSVSPDAVVIGIFITIITVPFFFGINIPKVLWSMKVMLITALMIFVFSIMAENTLSSSLSDTLKFLTLISLSALYIEKSDLLEMASSLSCILSPAFGKKGRRFASSVMMALALFPIIFISAREMMRARKSRNDSFLAHPVSSVTDYTVSLMRLLFQKVVIFQDAMYSRGWSEDGERTAPLIKRRDRIFSALSLILFLGYFLWIKLR
ncbi:MAG: hypothetical protein ACI4S4_04315 [Candidatus Ornithospirochaeta sp.]